MTSNNQSSIAKSSDIKIQLKSKKEACPLDLAPTSSTTNALAFGDALAIALLEAKGFTKKDFASSHPAGKLGKKLITQVQDLMHVGSKDPKVNPNTFLDKALIEVTKKNLGITLISEKSKIIGIFTDGDLRRCINNKINRCVSKYIIGVSLPKVKLLLSECWPMLTEYWPMLTECSPDVDV